MKRRNVILWIAAGLVASTIILFIVTTLRSSGALISARVVRFNPDKTNAVLEITNNVGFTVHYSWWSGQNGNSFEAIGPHETVQIPISLVNPQFNSTATRQIAPRMDRFFYRPALRLGINLYQWYEVGAINLTNTTGWIDAKPVQRPSNAISR
jgi:hypothetical protein